MPVPASTYPATPLALRFAQRARLRARRERWARHGLAAAAALLGLLVIAMPLFLLGSASAGTVSATPLISGG